MDKPKDVDAGERSAPPAGSAILMCSEIDCNTKRIVLLSEYEPKGTAKIVTACPKHIESGTFEMIRYYDKAGKELFFDSDPNASSTGREARP